MTRILSPEHRAAISLGIRRRMEDPAYRAQCVKNLKAAHATASARMRAQLGDPAFVAKKNAAASRRMKEFWPRAKLLQIASEAIHG